MSNYTQYKVWDGYIFPFQFANVLVISYHTLPGVWIFIHAGIKINPLPVDIVQH